MTKRGYSLLEVLVALAILAGAMAVLLGAAAASNQQTTYSNELTRASLLARSKMIDLEFEIMRDGFSDLDKSYRGTFREEGHDAIEWEATVAPVEIPEEEREALLGRINAQLFGGVDGEGALQGNAAFSSMLPLLIAQFPNLINRIGEKVRRVELVVTFPYGAGSEELKLVQYVVDRQNANFNVFESGAIEGSL